MTANDTEIARYDAAIRAGLSGDEAADFASLLKGDNPAEVNAFADKLVSFINEISTNPEDRPVRATDHSQGHGMPTDEIADNPLADFRHKMQEVFRR